MHQFPEIAGYWAWQLDRVRWFGLTCQFLGLLMFLALWWHQDRAWRILRWFLALYLLVLAGVRFGMWILYALVETAMTEALKPFMFRSGIVGIALCIATIAFLIIDAIRKWIHFDHFSPEIWGSSKPSIHQWAGLVLAFITLWSPFTPNPVHIGGSLFTWGFPTSFGVTLAPTLLFFAGLILAGSKRPNRAALISIGALATAGIVFVDPITLHGIIAACMSVLIILFGLLKK